MMIAAATDAPLRRTPLHALNVSLGAKLVAFAGWDMPISYRTGIVEEHLSCRRAAGLFDVSHMGMLHLSGAPGVVAAGLERLIPIDLLGLPTGRQRYGFLLDDAGGILDDIMVSNLGGGRYVVVVNAANARAGFDHVRAGLPNDVAVEIASDALIALQGPRAEEALAALAPQARDLEFLHVREMAILEARCLVSRSGYTGEDGFEIAAPRERAVAIAEALLALPGVTPVGLGARDSLRLEAGLPLHGADISRETTPVEAGLSWAIPRVRRAGGARAGGFPGAARILAEIESGPTRCRVGLRPSGRVPVRAGAPLFETETAATPAGRVTSGGFAPSLGAPAAMGSVPIGLSAPGRRLFADVRGQRLCVEVCDLPFVASRVKRAIPQPSRASAC